MHIQVMAENVMHTSGAEGASDFACFIARAAADAKVECEPHCRAAAAFAGGVVVPYLLELHRKYGKEARLRTESLR
jgi:hypothetical protein